MTTMNAKPKYEVHLSIKKLKDENGEDQAGEIDNEISEWLMQNIRNTIESCQNPNCDLVLISVE